MGATFKRPLTNSTNYRGAPPQPTERGSWEGDGPGAYSWGPYRVERRQQARWFVLHEGEKIGQQTTLSGAKKVAVEHSRKVDA